MEYISKTERNTFATRMAQDFKWVYYNGTFYMPLDYETLDPAVLPAPERTIWIPRTEDSIRDFVNFQFKVVFETPKHLSDFCFTVAQYAERPKHKPSSLLIVTDEGLRELKADGQLHVPDGTFIPNTLPIRLNTEPATKEEVFNQIAEWLDDEDEAHALLHHVATMLAPHWPSLKYLLLLGSGRNGKSVFLEMLTKLIGPNNRSTVSRQDIASASSVVTSLNNKLANVVMDGVAVYLRDSGLEKTLIAGEEAGIRMLYQSRLTPVQTNALFIEALNSEPKTKDKSSALQARLVRFEFPNSYADDPAFKARMLSDEYLGALLALLIDHYVKQDQAPLLLAPTSKQIELKQGHVLHNSLAMQYLVQLVESVPEGANSLIGKDLNDVAATFKSWRVREGDITPWSDQDIFNLFRPMLVMSDRKSKRVGNRIVKVRSVEGFNPDTLTFLNNLEGVPDGANVQPPLVDD